MTPSLSILRTQFAGAAVWATALLVTLAAAAPTQGENWPGWRGPQRTGVSTEENVPLAWSAESGIRWKVKLPGAGVSCPVIWGDRVFITASDGPQQSDLHVLCLARNDGRELWHARYWGTAPTLYHPTKSGMASPTPVTDGRHLFAFFGTGDAFCLDVEGHLVWHRSLASEYGRFENRFAATSSPLLYEDLVILQCDHYGDSYLVAIDQKTGANRWKVDRPETWLSWSSPQLVPVDGGATHELVVCASEKIDAFNPATGDKLWTVGGMQRECIPTPVLGHGLIYAVSGPKGFTYAIRPGGRGDVTHSHVVWSNQRGAPFVPSAILVGDHYYLVDDAGIATCLDAHSGERIWQKRLPGNFTASPVAAAGRVYLTNEEGVTTVLDAAADDYRLLSTNRLGEPVFASPAIAHGHFFIRAARNLYCIEQTPSTEGGTP